MCIRTFSKLVRVSSVYVLASCCRTFLEISSSSSFSQLDAAPDTVIENVALVGTCAALAPMTECAPTAAYAAPDTVIEYVAPVDSCAAPAPVTEYAPTAACAAPDTVIEYVAPAGICTAPAPADVTERWGDVDTSESMSEMSGDAAVNGDGSLDTVFDAICELAGEDGRDWVLVRQIQAQTSLRLERLEELLEECECMGVICRDDTRLEVAFCPSIADALEDEY